MVALMLAVKKNLMKLPMKQQLNWKR